MSAITHTEINETNFDMSANMGGSSSVVKIEDDVVCSTCNCYVDEVDVDAYYCKKCEEVIYSS